MTIHHDLPNRIQNRSSNLTYEDLIERWPSMRRRALAEGGDRIARVWDYLEICLEQRRPAPMRAIFQLKRFPVDIEEFVASEEFLGGRIQIWPALMADLKALNPDVLVGEAPVHEAFLGGATGTGKSTLAKITLLYQLYLLTCFPDPRAQFGLDPTTRIVFPLMSTTRRVDRKMLLTLYVVRSGRRQGPGTCEAVAVSWMRRASQFGRQVSVPRGGYGPRDCQGARQRRCISLQTAGHTSDIQY